MCLLCNAGVQPETVSSPSDMALQAMDLFLQEEYEAFSAMMALVRLLYGRDGLVESALTWEDFSTGRPIPPGLEKPTRWSREFMAAFVQRDDAAMAQLFNRVDGIHSLAGNLGTLLAECAERVRIKGGSV